MSTPTANPPFQELQTKLYAALNGVISAPVFDGPLEDQTKPYVTIGEIVGTPDNWHGGFGWSVSASINVWTRQLGFKQANGVAEEIIPVLDHQQGAVALADTWRLVSIRHALTQTMRDPDPEIRRVRLMFDIVIHQEV